MRILGSHTFLRAASALLIAVALTIVFGQSQMLVPGILAVIALFLAGASIDRIHSGDRPSVEREWGGLGMESGGWRMSPSLAYLIAAVSFGAMSVAGLGIAIVTARPPAEADTARTPRQDQSNPKRTAAPEASPDGLPTTAGSLPKPPAVPAR